MEELDRKLTGFFGDRFHKRVFLILVAVVVLLLVASWLWPPTAIIDGSVLTAVAELFAFGALGEVGAAIERGHSASITHGNTTVTIKKDETELSEEQPEEEKENE